MCTHPTPRHRFSSDSVSFLFFKPWILTVESFLLLFVILSVITVFNLSSDQSTMNFFATSFVCEVHVIQSLVLCVSFCCRSLFVPLNFSCGLCIVSLSSIYSFWLQLPLLCVQTRQIWILKLCTVKSCPCRHLYWAVTCIKR